MTNPLFKPPLTKAQLQEIQERNRGNADVKALLREVKRLRATMLRIGQLCRMVPVHMGTAGMVYQGLVEDLEGEPVIEQLRALERRSTKPGDED